MFDASAMLFIYVETPLHAGTARSLGAVDLPIQRERTTDYPMVQASSLKGRLRAAARGRLEENEWKAIFGPETANASDHAGALAIGDARILLFPVRSLAGVFAWTTSLDVLARFQREATMAKVPVSWQLPVAELNADDAWVSGTTLLAGGTLVLEEFSFTPREDQAALVTAIGTWIAEQALPAGGEYAYWRRALPDHLCILPDEAFRDFARYATEVQTHVKIDPDTKTVAETGLWTVESLPVDTLLYAPLLASASRNGLKLDAHDVLGRIRDLDLSRTQLGGDETTGQGMVALRFASAEKGGSA
jgi:CRISPR-associated protein Cmr4